MASIARTHKDTKDTNIYTLSLFVGFRQEDFDFFKQKPTIWQKALLHAARSKEVMPRRITERKGLEMRCKAPD